MERIGDWQRERLIIRVLSNHAKILGMLKLLLRTKSDREPPPTESLSVEDKLFSGIFLLEERLNREGCRVDQIGRINYAGIEVGRLANGEIYVLKHDPVERKYYYERTDADSFLKTLPDIASSLKDVW